ncbi:putative Fibroblast growth factor receptor 3 [Hypsibius exemplaris]|uniref:Fibroblast growth factor receptor 3 n=1 Tax=Hypsibius exemplaris TaxID=2072580 RepID=A0A9X6NDP7_HYPEX|nr:putative Fibroblast growth factor receptor 3 [Hypsibius exemplaris]
MRLVLLVTMALATRAFDLAHSMNQQSIEAGRKIQLNTGYNGIDVAHVTTLYQEECWLACDRNIWCMVAVHQQSGRDCWLKGGVLLAQDDVSMTSYVHDRSPMGFPDFLAEGQYLRQGESLYSQSRNARLMMQTNGNLVLLEQPSGNVIWDTKTSGRNVTHALINGQLVLVENDSHAPHWTTDCSNSFGSTLMLQNDRDLVLYCADGTVAWQTLTATRYLTGRVEENVDYWGGDLQADHVEAGTETEERCWNLCIANPLCNLAAREISGSRCWLKSGKVSSGVLEKGKVVFLKSLSAGRSITPNVDYNGADLLEISTPFADECWLACDRNPMCQFASRPVYGFRCSLKTAGASVLAVNGSTSYARTMSGINETSVCPSGFTRGANECSGKCYTIVRFVSGNTFLSTWSMANTTCSKLNATLAVIADDRDQRCLMATRWIGVSDAWIGLHQHANSSIWSWVNGAPINYTNFISGDERKDKNLTRCAAVRTDGFWVSRFCDDLESSHAICMLGAVVPTTIQTLEKENRLTEEHKIIIGAGSTSTVLALIGLIFIVRCFRRKYCSSGTTTKAMRRQINMAKAPENKYEVKYSSGGVSVKLTKTVLGSGEYGLVIKGFADGLVGYPQRTVVAVKTLTKSEDPKRRAGFFREIEMMKAIRRHLNIVNLLGAIVEGDPMLILEFCCNGSLKRFLRKMPADLFYNHLYPDGNLTPYDEAVIQHMQALLEQTLAEETYGPNSFEPGDKVQSTRSLIIIAFQVARGMEYLAIQRIVHRDVAARNVLMADRDVAKLSDFGMAIHESDTAEKEATTLLPVKWMAPEAILSKAFSEKSDVWSFAVLLHEIFTLGGDPYQDFNVKGKVMEFIAKVTAGSPLMPRPAYYPLELFEKISMRSFAVAANERPLFSEIRQILEDFIPLTRRDEYVEMDQEYEIINKLLDEGQATDVPPR